VFYVLRSHEWQPKYGNGVMPEQGRFSFESGVSRRLQRQQGLRRPGSFKQGCHVSERSLGSEEPNGASCSAAFHLGVGGEVARNRPPMGGTMALGVTALAGACRRRATPLSSGRAWGGRAGAMQSV
jgi:hypothetical protein